jgi:hypothetical protein
MSLGPDQIQWERPCSRPGCCYPALPDSGNCSFHTAPERKQCAESVTHRTGGYPTTRCGNMALPDSDFCRLHDSRTAEAARSKARNRDMTKSRLRNARRAAYRLGEKEARAMVNPLGPSVVSPEEWTKAGQELTEAEEACTALGISPQSVGW